MCSIIVCSVILYDGNVCCNSVCLCLCLSHKHVVWANYHDKKNDLCSRICVNLCVHMVVLMLPVRRVIACGADRD